MRLTAQARISAERPRGLRRFRDSLLHRTSRSQLPWFRVRRRAGRRRPVTLLRRRHARRHRRELFHAPRGLPSVFLRAEILTEFFLSRSCFRCYVEPSASGRSPSAGDVSGVNQSTCYTVTCRLRLTGTNRFSGKPVERRRRKATRLKRRSHPQCSSGYRRGMT